MYIVSLLSKFSSRLLRNTHTEGKLPRSWLDPFPGSWTWLSPELSKIRPHDSHFFGFARAPSMQVDLWPCNDIGYALWGILLYFSFYFEPGFDRRLQSVWFQVDSGIIHFTGSSIKKCICMHTNDMYQHACTVTVRSYCYHCQLEIVPTADHSIQSC